MSDLRSHTLIELVRHRVSSHRPVTITPAGVPCRLHGDSFSLVVLLDHLIERVSLFSHAASFELSADAAARWIFIDLIWSGVPIPSTLIDQWKTEPLTAALGGLTVGDVLRHHRSDLWSDAHSDGQTRLRLPLPPALETPELRGRPAALAPDFTDMALLRQPLMGGDLGALALDSLTFVVFDAETTGGRPEDGDEIVAIAAVRVQNRRILTCETFQALVNPGRTIPPEAVCRHGITDEQVRDHPDLPAILPQFWTFAEGAVLVAHDATGELRFLRARERACGVRFDHPVLDTMVLSACLHGPIADHSLDGLTRRLGIAAIDRHTVLGDCLTTAAVLLALIDLLRDRGVTTLGQALSLVNTLIDRQAREHIL